MRAPGGGGSVRAPAAAAGECGRGRAGPPRSGRGRPEGAAGWFPLAPPAPGPRPGLAAGVGRAPEPSRASIRARAGAGGAPRGCSGGAGRRRGPPGAHSGLGPRRGRCPSARSGAQPPGPDPSRSRLSAHNLKTSGLCRFPAGSLLKSPLEGGSGLAVPPPAPARCPRCRHIAPCRRCPGGEGAAGPDRGLTPSSHAPLPLPARGAAAGAGNCGTSLPPALAKPATVVPLPPAAERSRPGPRHNPCRGFASRGCDPNRPHPDPAGFPKIGR